MNETIQKLQNISKNIQKEGEKKMNNELRKIYDELFGYIADIEGLQDDDYYAILGNLNTLIGHILNVEKWNKREKETKEELKKINLTGVEAYL